MWSIGCIFAELLQKKHRRPIFIGKNIIEIYKNILNILGKQELNDIKCSEKFSKKMFQNYGKNEKREWNSLHFFQHVKDAKSLDLLDKFLQFNPDKRITIEDAIKHPYFEDIFSEDDLITFDSVNFEFDEKESSNDKYYIKSKKFINF